MHTSWAQNWINCKFRVFFCCILYYRYDGLFLYCLHTYGKLLNFSLCQKLNYHKYLSKTKTEIQPQPYFPYVLIFVPYLLTLIWVCNLFVFELFHRNLYLKTPYFSLYLLFVGICIALGAVYARFFVDEKNCQKYELNLFRFCDFLMDLHIQLFVHFLTRKCTPVSIQHMKCI